MINDLEIQRLLEERELFGHIIAGTPTLICGIAPDGRTTFINPRVEAVTGYPSKELVGQNWWTTFYPGDEYKQVEKLFSYFQKGSVKDYEMTLTTKNGEKRVIAWNSINRFDKEGVLIEVVGVGNDLTERYEKERQHQESEMRFRQLAESVQEVFWMTDPAKNKMLYISPAYERIWGRSCQSLYDTPISFLDALHPEDRPQVMAAFPKQALGTYDEEYRILRPDGSIRWIRDRAFPIKDAGGHVYRVAGIAQDMTDRKHMDTALRQSEKLSAVGQLAAGVAHEVNNPLGVILGFAQSILLRLPSQDALMPAMKAIERETLRCKVLVQELLTFSRERKPGMAPEPPNTLLDGALALIETQARLRRIELRREFAPGLPPVMADRNQIQQVIINLCTNAMDAMPEGGLLRTAMEKKPGHLEIRVQDTGTGILPSVQPRIFEPFFTTKEVGKGTGLGLSLAYEIVQKHHGQLTFETLPEKGTTFFVKLPLAA
jgi:two-component system, cell cycle sensor histidine kinase and response regulator CckA